MPTRSRLPIALAFLSAWAAPAAAQTPAPLGYQGRLLRADGTAATGTAQVMFSVYDAATGGSLVWTETQTLGLSDGYYSTFMGLVSPPAASALDGGARWLEVRVGSETLVPRQQIGAVAYAVTAQSVRGGVASVSSLDVGGQTVVDAAGRLAGPARYSAGSGLSLDDPTRTLSLQDCPAGQTLVRDATSWLCAVPSAGTVTVVTAADPLVVTDASSAPHLTLPRAGSLSSGYLASTDWASFNARFGATTTCGGDLSGTLAAPVVARLQSRPVSTTQPSNGQVLKWNGAQWEPDTDSNSGGTVTSVRGNAPLTVWNGSTVAEISIAAANGTTDGYLSTAEWSRFNAKYDAATQCGGDLLGASRARLSQASKAFRCRRAFPARRRSCDTTARAGRPLRWESRT